MRLRRQVAALLGAASLLAACGVAGSPAAVATTSSASPGIDPSRTAPPARVDPALRSSLRTATWVRGIVAVGGSAGTCPSGGSPMVRAGPYAGIKRCLNFDEAQGLRLITDYDQLPLLLVEIRDLDALERLAGMPGVEAVSFDGTVKPAQ